MIKVGFPISMSLQNTLQSVLDGQDLVDVAEKVPLSFSTVKGLYYRSLDVTNTNQAAAFGLVNKAFEKATENLAHFTKIKGELEMILPKPV
tara:strand:+ start:114 stop:386 length:273 start_codon:yes stop_codon:yes gene_type:complete